MAYVVNVSMLLDVEDDAEAADAINEILREETREFDSRSCLLDYTHHYYEYNYIGENRLKEITIDRDFFPCIPPIVGDNGNQNEDG